MNEEFREQIKTARFLLDEMEKESHLHEISEDISVGVQLNVDSFEENISKVLKRCPIIIVSLAHWVVTRAGMIKSIDGGTRIYHVNQAR